MENAQGLALLARQVCEDERQLEYWRPWGVSPFVFLSCLHCAKSLRARPCM